MASSDTMNHYTFSTRSSDWMQYECDPIDPLLQQLSCDMDGAQVYSLEPNGPDDFQFDSDYLSNSSSSSEAELGNTSYHLQNLTSFSMFDRPGATDNDNSSVTLDDIFLHDVDQLDSFGPRSALPDQHQIYQNQSYVSPPGGLCHNTLHTYRHSSYSSSSEALSAYSMSPQYENVSQNTFMISNLPNLPDLEVTSSPALTRYGGSSDDGTDSESEEPRTRKGKRGSKSILLWKFLLDILENPKHAPTILRWENQENGIFKFVDTGAVARLWGEQKRKQDMNFEKLSRGIRHYYKAGMMNRVEGKRLVYKFNWKKVPREYRRRQRS